jgi:diaminopimelate decarboxylase
LSTDNGLSIHNQKPHSSNETPVLPQAELVAFVQKYLGQRDKYLRTAGLHPPPLYLLETSVLKERADQFRSAFQAVLPQVSFYYAVKSNNHPDVAAVLIQSGFGLDVSSGLELKMALELGAKDIVFSGPGKTDAELHLAVLHREQVLILADSFGELGRLKRIAESQDHRVRVGVRLTTDPNGFWRKFGISPGALKDFWKDVHQCDRLKFQGLQFHLSWNLSPRLQIEFIRRLEAVLNDLPPECREEIEFIDIGGGYWPSQGEWLQASGTPEGLLQTALGQASNSAQAHYKQPAMPIEAFADQLGSAIRQHLFTNSPSRICFEPGRWICNDAMHLLISVVDKKESNLVITDAGTNAVGWERFETDYFPVINLTRPALKERPCDILGSLCTPHDIWGYSYWGNDIQVGDILLIPTQGAYTYSLRQHFIKPLPRVIAI